MRTIQYFSRFYAWYLYRLNATPAEIAPYDIAKKQLGLIRKALRLGKFVEHFKAAAQAWDAKAGTSIQWVSAGRHALNEGHPQLS